MKKLTLFIALAAALAAASAHAATAPQPAAPSVPANLATVEGVTVHGKRCTLGAAGCTCRETDAACVRAVAEDMRLYFPKQYLAMASRCMREFAQSTELRLAFSDDPEVQQTQPGYNLQETDAHKTFCEKAYADAPAVKAALKASK